MDTNIVVAIVSASSAVIVAIAALLANVVWMGRTFAQLDKRIDERFSALEKIFTEKLLRVEQVIDARLSHLEEKRP